MSNYYHTIRKFFVQFVGCDRTKLEPKPDQDWQLMVVVFALMLILLIGASIIIDWRFVTRGEVILGVGRPATEVDNKALDQAAARIDARAREFDRLFLSAPSAVDPSH
jgi:hypothetical protein